MLAKILNKKNINMIILIIALKRSGGHQLNEWLALELGYKMIHEPDYDDYKNNAEEYLFFSLSWFVTAPIFLVVVIVQLLYKFAQWFLKYPNV